LIDLERCSAAEMCRATRADEISVRDIVEHFLDRSALLEPALRAWVTIDRSGARLAADRLDITPRARRGPLHGLPIGVKDLVDVAGQPTAAGFAPYAARVAASDATMVERTRAAGGIILGKTVTTQFAYMDPPVTVNPWSAYATPGGSSSGSAAAVSAGMVPAAIGSQTGGSVLRPAAYCGVVGIKPTYGRISRHGILPLAWSLDHPGWICRTVEDAALLLGAVAGEDPRDPESARVPCDEYLAGLPSGDRPNLVVLDDVAALARDAARASFEGCVDTLRRAGAAVSRGRFASGAELVMSVHAVIMQSEVAAVHRDTFAAHKEDYAERLRAYIETGALIAASDYARAYRLRARIARETESLLAPGAVLALPTVSGPAPGRDTTGDPTFQAIFSLLGIPSISIPSGLVDGRPVGLQLAGRHFGEASLLSVAAWCEREIPPIGPPPLGGILAA